VIFGDATDPEFLAHLPLARAEWLVMAVPEHDTGLTHDDPRHALLRAVRDLGYRGKIAVAAHREPTAEALAAKPADLVLMPYRDAAFAAARLISLRSRDPHRTAKRGRARGGEHHGDERGRDHRTGTSAGGNQPSSVRDRKIGDNDVGGWLRHRSSR
jgi:hypothetical protein